MGAVMRPPLWRDLRHDACVLDAEFFAQQGTRFVEPVVLRRESHPRIENPDNLGYLPHAAARACVRPSQNSWVTCSHNGRERIEPDVCHLRIAGFIGM